MIELVEDGLETLNEVSAWELKISEIDLIEDAGEFSPDESVAWACMIDGTWFSGDRPKFNNGIAINPPKWATHIIWSEE